MHNQSSNRKRIVAVVVVVIIALILLLTWCNRPPQVPPASAPVQSLPATTATGSLQPSESQPAGTGESPATASPTNSSPQPAPQATVVIQQVDVRKGPGLLFPILTSLPQGTVLPVIGRNEQSTWLFVLLLNGQQGWIPLVAVQLNVEVESLPIVEAPPEPTQKPTASPYGQGMLGHPDLPGLAPAAQITPVRKALAAFSVLALAGAAGSLRLVKNWRKGKKASPALHNRRSDWLVRLLASLF